MKDPSVSYLVPAGYALLILAVSWAESWLLAWMRLATRRGGLIYALLVNPFTAVVAPVGALAAMIAGMLGVFGAINNTEGISTDQAFRAVAVPIAWVALIIILVVRVLPLLLMNLRSLSKALLYAVVSSAVLMALFTVAGIVALGWLGH